LSDDKSTKPDKKGSLKVILQNFLPTKFIKVVPLLVVFLMALLLAGCGENPTVTPATTTTAPTIAATNPPSRVTTQAVSTTSAAITGKATTSAVNTNDLMPAAYPEAVLLDLPRDAQQAFSDNPNKLELKDATYHVFIVKADPTKIHDYYGKLWRGQDYHLGTQIKIRSNQVVTESEFFVKDDSEVAVVTAGPLDDAYIHTLTNNIPALNGKLKAGDTIFAVASGTWVPFE
jgi:hypothetical protein